MEMRDEFDPVELALMPESVRRLCEVLIGDVAGRRASVAELASPDPVFIVRSARPSLFKEFLDELHKELPDQELVVLSHEKDRKLIRETVKNPHEFIPYPVGGPYSWDVLEKEIPSLMQRRFGARVLLDTSGVLTDLKNVADMLRGLQGGGVYSWADSGLGLIELSPSRKSRLAQEALEALARWNACRLDLEDAD